jgi:hypothetical protein
VLLKGLYFLTQTLLPLLADGGAVVNTTNNSTLLSRLEPGYSAYASMKGGLIVLTRWRRSSAHAGSASTPSRPVHPHTDRRQRLRALPRGDSRETALGRLGEAHDIGLAIAVLLSEAGRSTGSRSTLGLERGWTRAVPDELPEHPGASANRLAQRYGQPCSARAIRGSAHFGYRPDDKSGLPQVVGPVLLLTNGRAAVNR